jgi:hypothetical protein
MSDGYRRVERFDPDYVQAMVRVGSPECDGIVTAHTSRRRPRDGIDWCVACGLTSCPTVAAGGTQ